MAKISSYVVDSTPQLADKVIGTSISGPPDNNTANFTLQSILDLFVPRLTTTEINALVSPTAGTVVYNTTLNVLCYRDNVGWKKVTSTVM